MVLLFRNRLVMKVNLDNLEQMKLNMSFWRNIKLWTDFVRKHME